MNDFAEYFQSKKPVLLDKNIKMRLKNIAGQVLEISEFAPCIRNVKIVEYSQLTLLMPYMIVVQNKFTTRDKITANTFRLYFSDKPATRSSELLKSIAMPLPNVYHTGEVCLGSLPFNQGKVSSVNFLNAFFNSKFNGEVRSFNPRFFDRWRDLTQKFLVSNEEQKTAIYSRIINLLQMTAGESFDLSDFFNEKTEYSYKHHKQYFLTNIVNIIGAKNRVQPSKLFRKPDEDLNRLITADDPDFDADDFGKFIDSDE
jgi:hypothetical protein